MDIKAIDNEYVAHTYARFPVAFVGGQGSALTDDAGREYIDLGTGIAVNVFGAADPIWQEAVTRQIAALPHASNLYYTEPCAKLAQLLCERTGMKKVFFGNSGAEANECAIKAARLWSFTHYGESRKTIVTLKNSFHGRTIATLAATGQDVFHEKFGPFPEGFVYADPTDAQDVIRLIEENNACAVMMEMVQGEGGVYPLTKEFVQTVADYAAAHDVLLIVDEVQTGNGRCGSLYAYMDYGITPDIVSTAKGIGGGLPLGACMLGEKTADLYVPGTHGSTFGGNPVACAGAYSILSRIDDALLAGVKERADYIFAELSGAKGVKSVSGKGLMIGIECEKPAREVIDACLKKGVVVLSAKTKVRLLPALNIPMDQLKKAIAVLKEVIAE
ncbi:MAG: aminotransferase class III-fold pyridoxal phosphate-dependent enzyme [Ruminococcaceae bacterium]|nr:aminotransferase class III-fold pyridoxal phosphate-dependent enzyme [Oscillospiraceae bacterium]